MKAKGRKGRKDVDDLQGSCKKEGRTSERESERGRERESGSEKGQVREEEKKEEKSGSELEGVNWRDVYRARVGTRGEEREMG